MSLIYVFLADGFEDIEALATVDVARRADIIVKTVSVMDKLTVTSSHGVIMTADIICEDMNIDEGDMIMLPGGLPGADTLASHAVVKDAIMDFATKGKFLAAICAAPMVFGLLGILRNINVTCYPGFEKYLTHAHYTAAQVEVDGSFITGNGPGACIPFALQLVKALKGEAKAKEIAAGMQVEWLSNY